MTPETVGVVIPVLNDAAGLRHVLDDLRAEPSLEVVVVDGGSLDDSLAVAQAADKVISTPPSRGGQLRAGTAATAREWLWFVHADTRLDIEALGTLASGPSTPGWGYFAVRLDDASWPYRIIETTMNWRSWATGIATGDQGIFVHRGLLDAIGGVPRQPLLEDVELSKRLRRLAKPHRIPTRIATSSRRWREGGILRTVVLMWLLRLRYFLGWDPEALARAYER